MARTITLSGYVKRRNGMPMGASGSLVAMLQRAFGAGSFDRFWHHWNPIWGFYLGRMVMKPLSKVLPIWLALVVTFLVSGALHDVAISAVKLEPTLLFTPWFTLMGIWVVLSKRYQVSYSNSHWLLRTMLNSAAIFLTFWLAKTL